MTAAATGGADPSCPATVFDGYALDLDGTVYLDDRLLPGAADTIAPDPRGGCAVVFVTNKPLESADDYAAKLTRLGISADAHRRRDRRRLGPALPAGPAPRSAGC